MYSDYTFNNATNINNDICHLSQNSIQNTNLCNRQLQNFFHGDNTMKTPIDLATSQPGILYKGGNTIASGGDNIDVHTQMTIGSVQLHEQSRVDLFQRPFLTIPYLGKGSVDSDIEFRLKKGSINMNKKTYSNDSEISHFDYQQTPLLQDIRNTHANPSTRIEYNVDNGWVRGGLPSREMERDSVFYKN